LRCSVAVIGNNSFHHTALHAQSCCSSTRVVQLPCKSCDERACSASCRHADGVYVSVNCQRTCSAGVVLQKGRSNVSLLTYMWVRVAYVVWVHMCERACTYVCACAYVCLSMCMCVDDCGCGWWGWFLCTRGSAGQECWIKERGQRRIGQARSSFIAAGGRQNCQGQDVSCSALQRCELYIPV